MKNRDKLKRAQKKSRSIRIRKRLHMTDGRFRLSVFRSLKHIGGQIIDARGNVLVAVSDVHLPAAKKKLPGVPRARATGELLAAKAKEKKIVTVVFDKSHYKFHGRVKEFAEGARTGGLTF
ncbi:MAG: 50S ribosomal protein L18 [Patescibacteria group bacterium]